MSARQKKRKTKSENGVPRLQAETDAMKESFLVSDDLVDLLERRVASLRADLERSQEETRQLAQRLQRALRAPRNELGAAFLPIPRGGTYSLEIGFGRKIALCAACDHDAHGLRVCGMWRKNRRACPCDGRVVDESKTIAEPCVDPVTGEKTLA